MPKLAQVDASWTLFLDRDGVINERVMGGYVLHFNEFRFKQGVLQGAKELFGKFGRVIVVTNQQCVAKGLLHENELTEIHRQMIEAFLQHGAKIDKVFAALERKEEAPYMRKPNPSMGKLAKEVFPEIDFTKSIMVGDTDSDLLFGQALGMKTVLIETEEKISVQADIQIKELSQLSEYI